MPGCRLFELEYELRGCRLSTTGFADDAERLPRQHVERKAVDRPYKRLRPRPRQACRHGIVFADVPGAQHRLLSCRRDHAYLQQLVVCDSVSEVSGGYSSRHLAIT